MIPREASALTRERPDIWLRGLALATSITGLSYPHKAAPSTGALQACGFYPPKPPPVPLTPKEIEEEGRQKVRDDIAYKRRWIQIHEREISDGENKIKEIGKEILHKRRRIKDLETEISDMEKQLLSPLVPTGAMEWLLHEVGHWVVADDRERALTNYGLSESTTGHDGDREIEAWAFAEIVMAPFGSARALAPPTQREGAAFDVSGPIAQRHFARAERQIAAAGVSIDHMRMVWGDWVKWGAARGVGRAPWETEN